MIECDSSEITSDRIRSLLYEIGENLIKSNEFEIQSKSATKPGDNYIGIVHRVTYERKNDKNQIQANNLSTIILKTTPTNPVRREAFGSRNFFLREIYVYNDLLSYFEQFQRSKQIDIPKDGFTEYARCYRTIDVEPDECILLEDLSVNGFSMIDKQKEVITADHVKLVMQVMGKFHAISFAIKHQEPDKFKEIIANLGEVCFHSGNDIFRKFFCVLQKQTMDAITGTELMEKCDKIIEESFFDVVVKSVIGEPAEPFAIICHGDCWSNNNLFKYDENGKPIEVCLIDWQVTRYASPATDILYYIFGCVGKELRVSNYDIFLKTYYESLSSYLKRFVSTIQTSSAI